MIPRPFPGSAPTGPWTCPPGPSPGTRLRVPTCLTALSAKGSSLCSPPPTPRRHPARSSTGRSSRRAAAATREPSAAARFPRGSIPTGASSADPAPPRQPRGPNPPRTNSSRNSSRSTKETPPTGPSPCRAARTARMLRPAAGGSTRRDPRAATDGSYPTGPYSAGSRRSRPDQTPRSPPARRPAAPSARASRPCGATRGSARSSGR